jgi:putative oxidoreductase
LDAFCQNKGKMSPHSIVFDLDYNKSKTLTMNTLEKIGNYGERHHPIWIDFIRIILGAAFFIKGLQFLMDPVAVLEGASRAFLSLGAIHYVILTHLVGGLLIILGIATRIAILFQIPVLVWALFAGGNAFGIAYASWIYVLITFLLSILILLLGSGPLSIDKYWKKHPNS